MRKCGLSLILLLAPFLVNSAEANDNWELTTSTLSYKIVFPMHHPQGVSRDGKGSGSCAEQGCVFMVSAPIKSFDSQNKKRDQEMMKTMRGEQNPEVKVTASFPQFPAQGEKIKAQLTIEMSGEKALYSDVEFQLLTKTNEVVEVQGVIPMLLEDFKVTRPSLMGVKVKNLCPVSVNATWVKK